MPSAVPPYYLLTGDCLEVLATFPDNSIDTMISDPPYGLSFMGKGWDRGVPGPEFWKAALRVAKPGSLLLAFGGTRMYHRLTCAIEDAGWEIRDCMMWLYGSGFPKSHDISKAIDDSAGATRKVIGQKAVTCGSGDAFGKSVGDRGGATTVPITEPATAEAKLWEGWGTALKPAWEPIVVAMKPLDGTYAQNALRYGVSGLNIDGSRIQAADNPVKWAHPRGHGWGGYEDNGPCEATENTKGRFPANLLLDEESAKQLDAQTGILHSGKMKAGQERNKSKGKGGYHQNFPDQATARDTPGDSGGASRFFYVSKASKSDRGEGNVHPTVKPSKLMEYLCTLTKTPTGGTVLDPFMGSGTTGLGCLRTGRQFIGIDLMPEHVDIARTRLDREWAQRSGAAA